MKAGVWFMLAMLLPVLAMQGQELNKKYMDPRFEREVLVGVCDRAGLEADEEFGSPFAEEYANYQPNAEVIGTISKHREKYTIMMVLGTWCGDSQEQVPRFFRILDEAGIKASKLSMVCVDGKKSCHDIDLTPYNIEFVPTIIFFRKGNELGRIVESPQNSLEEDMLNIIQ